MPIRMPLNNIIMKKAPKMVAVLGDFGVHGGDQSRPIQIQMPAEEDLLLTRRNHAAQGLGRNPPDRDEADGQ